MSQATQLKTEQRYVNLTDNNIAITSGSYEHRDHVAANTIVKNTLFEQASIFSYHDRLRLSFFLRHAYRLDFVLIRGLIDFHRTRNLKFSFDRNTGSIQTDIHRSEVDELQAFLLKISQWFQKEKQFKAALRKVLDFENRYKAERDSVYQNMKGVSLITT